MIITIKFFFVANLLYFLKLILKEFYYVKYFLFRDKRA